jgi:hypothetical protein
LVTGRTWYAWGSCRKPKSLWGMSSMPRVGASCGGCGEARGGAGDRMRVGRVGVLSARGLHHLVSVVPVCVCCVCCMERAHTRLPPCHRRRAGLLCCAAGGRLPRLAVPAWVRRAVNTLRRLSSPETVRPWPPLGGTCIVSVVSASWTAVISAPMFGLLPCNGGDRPIRTPATGETTPLTFHMRHELGQRKSQRRTAN